MKGKSILLLLIILLALTGCRKKVEPPAEPPVEQLPVEQEQPPVETRKVLRVEISRGGLSTTQLSS